MIRFGEAFVLVHKQAVLFAAAFPIVAAIAFLAELAQHGAEMAFGVYDEAVTARASGGDPRLAYAGFVEAVALGIPAYWLVRWLHSGRSRLFARRLEKRALGLFVLVLSLQILFHFLALFVWTNGPLSIGFFIFGLLFLPLISRFVAAAPLGIFIAPRASMRVMVKDYPFALSFSMLAPLPLLIARHALRLAAVHAPGTVARWLILLIDSVVAAWLALIVIGVGYLIASRPLPLDITVPRKSETGTNR